MYTDLFGHIICQHRFLFFFFKEQVITPVFLCYSGWLHLLSMVTHAQMLQPLHMHRCYSGYTCTDATAVTPAELENVSLIPSPAPLVEVRFIQCKRFIELIFPVSSNLANSTLVALEHRNMRPTWPLELSTLRPGKAGAREIKNICTEMKKYRKETRILR